MSIHLILGGTRSGKSSRALAIAQAYDGPYVFIATAQALDDEMKDRIENHRKERDARWETVEAPIELAHAINAAGPSSIVVDCCTLWLANVMLAERDINEDVTRLLSSLQGSSARIVLVSNEVGSGIVPENALGRRFRDEQGRLNQCLAAISDAVDLVVAGLPLQLKG